MKATNSDATEAVFYPTIAVQSFGLKALSRKKQFVDKCKKVGWSQFVEKPKFGARRIRSFFNKLWVGEPRNSSDVNIQDTLI